LFDPLPRRHFSSSAAGFLQNKDMTPIIREAMRLLFDGGVDPIELQWFDLSGYISDQSHVVTEPLMTHRPPFEKNFVVWRGKTKSHESYDVMLMVAGDDPQEGIVVSMWKGPTGRMPVSFPAMVYLIDDDVLRYGPVDDDIDLPKDTAELMLAYVGQWLESLSQQTFAYKPSVIQSFTNRRKIATGKMPTYDWTTVKIGPRIERGESKGGTHASPRQHDRRGHLRRLRSGKTCWVKSCKVGDPSKGIVFHDYEIRTNNAASA
jgi:hypothetical protein